MKNSRWPNRLYVLDVSRGFSALAVVLWHWIHFAYEGTARDPEFDVRVQPFFGVLRIFYERGFLGVEYFFLLSGFIFFWLYRVSIEEDRLSFRNFLVKRLSRLYPLHLLTLAMVVLLQQIYRSISGDFFVYPFNDAYHFVLNLGFASSWGLEKGWSYNAPVWSVSVEILLYILFFVKKLV